MAPEAARTSNELNNFNLNPTVKLPLRFDYRLILSHPTAGRVGAEVAVVDIETDRLLIVRFGELELSFRKISETECDMAGAFGRV